MGDCKSRTSRAGRCRLLSVKSNCSTDGVLNSDFGNDSHQELKLLGIVMRINMTIEAKRVRGDLHMPELFQRDRCVIGKHVRNIFKEGELEKKAVWATGILKEYMKKGYGKNMTKREKQLKIREQKHKWAQIGMFGEKRSCPYCESINIIQIYKNDAWACMIVMNGLKNRAMTLIVHIAAGVPRLHMKFIGILISMLEVRTLERCGGGKIINTK